MDHKCEHRQDACVAVGLFAFTLISRIPFCSQILYHWDSVNLAYAMREFDMAKEQPQAPGYIVYVWLCRLVDGVVHDAQTTMVILSIAASALAVVALFCLGRAMFDRRIGLIAALFMATSPLFWFYGEIALPHTLDTLLVIVSVWWLCEVMQGHRRYLYPAITITAVAGGIRQQTVVFLAPLLLFALRRVGWRRFFSAGALGAAICVAWFIPLMVLSGGIANYMRVVGAYAQRFQSTTSVFLGAGWPGVQRNVLKLSMYTLYGGSMALVPGVLYALRRIRRCEWPQRWESSVFLTLWIVPAFVFYALVHMGQQGLVFVFLPALLLVGAVGLSRLVTTQPRSLMAAVGVLVALNAGIFCLAPEHPFGGDRFRLLTRATLVNSDQFYQTRFEAIKANFAPESTAILAASSRHVEYYLSEYVTLPFGIGSKWERDEGVFQAGAEGGGVLTPAELGLRLDNDLRAAVVVFDPALQGYNGTPELCSAVLLSSGDQLDYMELGAHDQLYFDSSSFGVSVSGSSETGDDVSGVSKPASVRTATRAPAGETAILGWHQEGHDAQHTGFSQDDVLAPWTFLWMWNGSCDNPLGSDCRPGDPEEGWTLEIPAKSHLVAGGGRLYLPAGEGGVWAIGEVDGKTAWHNGAIVSFCTAAFDPETNALFVAGSDRKLYKLNASNGTIADSFRADSSLNLAPTIAGSRVYAVSDSGTLYAINKYSMALEWAYDAGSPGQTPAAYSGRYDVLVLATEDLYVHAVNGSDGSRRWRRKPTPNVPGELDYDGGDGKTYRTYHYEHGWPVIADARGVVLIRLRLPKSEMWEVAGPENWFPSSNSAIRDFLVARPELQTLFALNLGDGSTAFVPAVGTGGLETPEGDNTLGPPPVVKRFPNGDEVAYTTWRNGQKCEAGDCSDPRWDAVLGEMVLDDTTVPGYQAGDCRFIGSQGSGDQLLTDEMGQLSMSGDVLFHSHWIALYPYSITDRSASRGATYGNPILVGQRYSVVNRASDEPGWVTCQPDAGHFCVDQMDTHGDKRIFDGGFWVFFNDCDPPYQCCTGSDCAAAYSDGYKPRYAIVSNGTLYYELNGGTVFAVRGAKGPQASVDKRVSPVAVSTGDTIVYTLMVVGNGLPLTLTDTLPDGVSDPGPLQTTLGNVAYDSDRRVVSWTGTPDLGQSALTSFTATVQVDGPRALINTVELTDADGVIVKDTAVAIVDARQVWLPQLLRNY